MALIKSVKGKNPSWGTNCFFTENATLAGDVVLGNNCSVWFNAVIRGDVSPIKIGTATNIQDNATIHASYQQSEVIIGNQVTIGHNAIIHGATIHDYALIGMHATILDHAEIGEGAVVAAGAIVLANTVIEPYTLWAGVPAKFIKKLPEETTLQQHKATALHYTMYADWYKE